MAGIHDFLGMTNERNLRVRDARDRMAALLGWGVPFPLRDLSYPGQIFLAGDAAAEILIEGAQAGVTYQLCDEEGEPFKGSVPLEAGAGSDRVVLSVPSVANDETYTILATRRVGSQSLETYLSRSVVIRAGIDDSLPVQFEREGIRVSERIVVGFGESVVVVLEDSQEGVTYRLFSETLDGGRPLAPGLKGDKGPLRFPCRIALTEDAHFRIEASAPGKGTKWLSRQLVAIVRGDPKVAIQVEPSIVEFGASARVAIPSPQAGVEYELLSFPVPLSSYELSESGTEPVRVQDGQRATVSLRPPGPGLVGSLPVVAEFTRSPEGLATVSPPLNDDVFFRVRATKTGAGEAVILNSAAAALVRPMRDMAVEAPVSKLSAGTDGWVTVYPGQSGVQYQLIRSGDGTALGVPGHCQADRAVGTSRIGIDFVVEDDGPPEVWLPTGGMDRTSLFRVVAIRNLTGVTAELNQQVTITVSSPEGSESILQNRGGPPASMMESKRSSIGGKKEGESRRPRGKPSIASGKKNALGTTGSHSPSSKPRSASTRDPKPMSKASRRSRASKSSKSPGGHPVPVPRKPRRS